MSEKEVLVYALALAGALLTAIWAMLRRDQAKTEEALDKKASSLSLDAVKADHKEELRQMREHFQEQLRELNRRQDREIDWLKQEMGRINTSLSEMRQEQSAANAQLTQNIQQIAIAIRGGRREI